MTDRTSTVPSVEDRLRDLGIELPQIAAPVAAYVPAVLSGEHVFTSGQLPMVDGALAATGKVGRTVSREEAKELAAICALNGLAAIKARIGTLDRITQIVKVVGYVASDVNFTEQPAVVNGASELLAAIFGGTTGSHARSAVGVAVLPLDAPVEVEITARFV